VRVQHEFGHGSLGVKCDRRIVDEAPAAHMTTAMLCSTYIDMSVTNRAAAEGGVKWGEEGH
jgi:hypothetical protein